MELILSLWLLKFRVFCKKVNQS